jgi:hypothetical protein
MGLPPDPHKLRLRLHVVFVFVDVCFTIVEDRRRRAKTVRVELVLMWGLLRRRSRTESEERISERRYLSMSLYTSAMC